MIGERLNLRALPDLIGDPAAGDERVWPEAPVSSPGKDAVEFRLLEIGQLAAGLIGRWIRQGVVAAVAEGLDDVLLGQARALGAGPGLARAGAGHGVQFDQVAFEVGVGLLEQVGGQGLALTQGVVQHPGDLGHLGVMRADGDRCVHAPLW